MLARETAIIRDRREGIFIGGPLLCRIPAETGPCLRTEPETLSENRPPAHPRGGLGARRSAAVGAFPRRAGLLEHRHEVAGARAPFVDAAPRSPDPAAGRDR